MLIADQFDWPAMVARLSLSGRARQILERAGLNKITTTRNGQIIFVLNVPASFFGEDLSDISKIESALSLEADTTCVVVLNFCREPQ